MTDFILAAPLPERLRAEAAALYLQAFEAKLGPVLGRDERARAYLGDCLRPDRAVAALSRDGGALLGVAGLQDAAGGFVGGGNKTLGPISAIGPANGGLLSVDCNNSNLGGVAGRSPQGGAGSAADVTDPATVTTGIEFVRSHSNSMKFLAAMCCGPAA